MVIKLSILSSFCPDFPDSEDYGDCGRNQVPFTGIPGFAITGHDVEDNWGFAREKVGTRFARLVREIGGEARQTVTEKNSNFPKQSANGSAPLVSSWTD